MPNDPTKWIEKESDLRNREHQLQRSLFGYSWNDWINFDNYIAWVIGQALREFKENGTGCPGDLTLIEWHDILDQMIAGFDLLCEGQSVHHHRDIEDNALALFAKHFRSLWD